ncbi:MAG: TlpA family protein disulfide reductase [Cellvibrionaceae bacterium]
MDKPANNTRRGGWLMLLISLLLLSGCGDTKLQQLDGRHLSWESLRGEWVFINYWAIWCAPCRKEIPELNAFSQGHVLGVNFDGPDLETLKQHTAELHIEFTQLQGDPAQLLGFERPSVLPATYVFDPNGVYRGVMMGPQTQASLLAWLQPGYQVTATGSGER